MANIHTRRQFAAAITMLACATGLWIWRLPDVARMREAEAGPARPATARERAAATRSIVAQLDAFRADDFRSATSYQSAGLRGRFRSPSDFRAMMRAHYPEFVDYARVSFGKALSSPDGSAVRVSATVTGRDGVVRRAVYLMVREQGTYRVAGVQGGEDAVPGTI